VAKAMNLAGRGHDVGVAKAINLAGKGHEVGWQRPRSWLAKATRFVWVATKTSCGVHKAYLH
jgi:hypothetical protein